MKKFLKVFYITILCLLILSIRVFAVYCAVSYYINPPADLSDHDTTKTTKKKKTDVKIKEIKLMTTETEEAGTLKIKLVLTSKIDTVSINIIGSGNALVYGSEKEKNIYEFNLAYSSNPLPEGEYTVSYVNLFAGKNVFSYPVTKDNKFTIKNSNTPKYDVSQDKGYMISQTQYLELENKKYEDGSIINNYDYSKLYLKNDSYELQYYEKENELKNKITGTYTKSDNKYYFDNGCKIVIKDDYVELVNPLDTSFKYYSVILFDSNKFDSIKNKIDNNLLTYLKKTKSNSNAAEIEKVVPKYINCFRYAFENDTLDEDTMTCSISYNLYVKGYNVDACNNDIKSDGTSDVNNAKYMPYLIPAGICESDHMDIGGFHSITLKDYKVLNSFSGL